MKITEIQIETEYSNYPLIVKYEYDGEFELTDTYNRDHNHPSLTITLEVAHQIIDAIQAIQRGSTD